MSTVICGWCDTKCHVTRVGKPVVTRAPYFGGGVDEWVVDAAFTCDGCGRMSVATWLTNIEPDDPAYRQCRTDDGPTEYEHARWSPTPGSGKSFPDVPEPIAKAALEAWLCKTAGAPRGACALARAVVEATAKAKDVTTGTLAAKIDALAKTGQVRQAVAEQAHAIRLVGNEVAHGDLDNEVTAEDADEVLELMGEVLAEVFQAPARASRLRATRGARQTKFIS